MFWTKSSGKYGRLKSGGISGCGPIDTVSMLMTNII